MMKAVFLILASWLACLVICFGIYGAIRAWQNRSREYCSVCQTISLSFSRCRALVTSAFRRVAHTLTSWLWVPARLCAATTMCSLLQISRQLWGPMRSSEDGATLVRTLSREISTRSCAWCGPVRVGTRQCLLAPKQAPDWRRLWELTGPPALLSIRNYLSRLPLRWFVFWKMRRAKAIGRKLRAQAMMVQNQGSNLSGRAECVLAAWDLLSTLLLRETYANENSLVALSVRVRCPTCQKAGTPSKPSMERSQRVHDARRGVEVETQLASCKHCGTTLERYILERRLLP